MDFIKGIVQLKRKISWKCTPSQAIRDVDEFVSSSEQIWRNSALHHLLTSVSSAVNGCRQNEFVNCAWSVHISLLSLIRYIFLLEKAILYRGHNFFFFLNTFKMEYSFLWMIILIFVSAVWTHSDGTHSLQRMHCWASNLMLYFSKSVLMKKQTHLHLGWREGEYVVMKIVFLVKLFLQCLKLQCTTQGVLNHHFFNNQDFR